MPQVLTTVFTLTLPWVWLILVGLVALLMLIFWLRLGRPQAPAARASLAGA